MTLEEVLFKITGVRNIHSTTYNASEVEHAVELMMFKPAIMKPKEKAEELVKEYWGKCCYAEEEAGYTICVHLAKQCALIAVDIILIDCGAKDWGGDEACEGKNYWAEVKNEIEKL